MFHLVKNANFKFMSQRKLWLGVSTAAVIASIGLLLFVGLNLGVEFTGGTALRLKFADTPDIGAVRNQLSAAGLNSESVTTIGEPEENELYIRLGTIEGDAGMDEELNRRVVEVLRGGNNLENDLNVVDGQTIEPMLAAAPGMTADSAAALTEEFLKLRANVALFKDYEGIGQLAGMTPEVLTYLKANSSMGEIALREQSYIGPAIGRELKKQAGVAIIGSLIGMLAWIWIRFQLQWGFAAVITLAHDTIVVLGLMAVFQKEVSLPVVAAFLTLVGYSVNDTVVVFDRIRENMAKKKGMRFVDVINLSINQTLSRTVITSGLTVFVTAALLLSGSVGLNAFAFVLTAGVIIGTYSSIFVASPLLLISQRFFEERKRKASEAAPAT